MTTDYLLGRSEKKSSSEEQETKDLKKFLEDNLDNGMTFGDGKVTQEDREKLEIALTQIFYRYHDEFKKRKEEKVDLSFNGVLLCGNIAIFIRNIYKKTGTHDPFKIAMYLIFRHIMYR